MTNRVYAEQPYAERGEPDTRNAEDDIFNQGNTDQLVLDVTKTESGYAGTLNVALYTDGRYDDSTDRSPDNSNPPGGSAPPNGSPP